MAKIPKSGPEQLRAGLQKKKMTQRQLADDLGVTPPLVTRWLKGERLPGRENMKSLKTMFGIPVEVWL